MSFFAKLFKQEPKPDFILHDIRFLTPNDGSLTSDDSIEALIDFESAHDCRIWLMSNDDCNGGWPPGCYDSSEMLPSGRHQVQRGFMFSDIDPEQFANGFTVTQARIIAAAETCGDLFDEIVPVQYLFVPFTPEQMAERQTADKDGLQIEFVSARYNGHHLTAGDEISVGAEIVVRIHTRCNDNVAFCCVPRTDLPFAYEPYSWPLDGVLDLSMTLEDTGSLRGFAVTARNRYLVEIGELLVDFPLTVADWTADGRDKPAEISLYGLYYAHNDDGVDWGSRVSRETELELYLHLRHQAQHGAVVRIFEKVNGEVGEKLMQSVLQPMDNCQTDSDAIGFWLDWRDVEMEAGETRKISGFVVVMSNVAGELLAETEVDWKLTIFA
ncbi:hypothetical protein [Wielerella bovis]|uniref:hypothetical protein n=1 Tax=Wielerella bovis TaxID=2917790 RepID=UPI002019FC61|nr:hypothetical protein [Wielerella bovis]MCG7657720.1 hypothetical protein [Wielerella bovis]MCG7659941.1 hypothetical protein [Wielerella bovis]